MLDLRTPLAVRRGVSFCEAIPEGEKEVQGIRAKAVQTPEKIESAWKEEKIPVLIDPSGEKTRDFLRPDVLVDAILAKENTGTKMNDASLVIGLGPGFTAGKDVHLVVETNRGHHLGEVVFEGAAEPDSGIPGEIGGFATERVLRAVQPGIFHPRVSIGDSVGEGSVVAGVDDCPVIAGVSGMVRGLLRDGTKVKKGMKVGDIDPRGKRQYCFTISEKARAIGGGVLEAILYRFNR
jgi:xanthine dehydrogenase accessory factor